MSDSDRDPEIDLRRMRHQEPGHYLLHQLGPRDQHRLVAAIDNGVPSNALAVMARWWQLENYLRLLVYIQLKARYGAEWQGPLKQRPLNRAESARQYTYMASEDDEHLLAHLDVTPLFELIENHWTECSHGIGLPLTIWKGRIAELIPIRHRLAHCRRPHNDDAARIEQLLRDLERGANRALRSYVSWSPVSAFFEDPVVDGWVKLHHPDAARLVEHGRENKGIYFELKLSSLPWAEEPGATGTPGRFWVMNVVMRDRTISMADYWRERSVRNLIELAGHVIQPYEDHISVTIPTMHDADVICDAIGGFLDMVFLVARPRRTASELPDSSIWPQPSPDPRVDAGGVLSVLSGLNEEDPCILFDAEIG